jgi:hypothetical protein
MPGIGTNVTIKHKFVSGKSDGADGTLVQPSNWNADENLGAGTDGQILVRDSGMVDGGSWVNFIRSYLAGCTLSNDGALPNTTIDVAAGYAVADDNTMPMVLSAITGITGGIWALGTAANKMDTVTAVAVNTWYHVYVIMRPDTGVVDILFSLSATAPTLPTNYTKKRRIGAFKTAVGTTNILAFTQDGDYFRWAASIADVSVVNPGTAAVLRALTVPAGVNVQALVHTSAITTSASVQINLLLSDPSANDEAPSNTYATVSFNAAGLTGTGVGPLLIRTNTVNQIRARQSASDANTTLTITTVGWIDSRGRNA